MSVLLRGATGGKMVDQLRTNVKDRIENVRNTVKTGLDNTRGLGLDVVERFDLNQTTEPPHGKGAPLAGKRGGLISSLEANNVERIDNAERHIQTFAAINRRWVQGFSGLFSGGRMRR